MPTLMLDRLKEYAYLVELDTEMPIATATAIKGLMDEAITEVERLRGALEAEEAVLKHWMGCEMCQEATPEETWKCGVRSRLKGKANLARAAALGEAGKQCKFRVLAEGRKIVMRRCKNPAGPSGYCWHRSHKRGGP